MELSTVTAYSDVTNLKSYKLVKVKFYTLIKVNSEHLSDKQLVFTIDIKISFSSKISCLLFLFYATWSFWYIIINCRSCIKYSLLMQLMLLEYPNDFNCIFTIWKSSEFIAEKLL